MEAAVRTPVTIALVNDYDIVVMGIAHILEQYQDRVVIAELDTNVAVSDVVDIVLYDCFAQPESDHEEISVLIRNPRARRVAVYTWNFHPDLIDSARRQGVHGYLSKALPARDLVSALEAIHAGDIVISDPPFRARSSGGLNWPGRSEGLTDRESENLGADHPRQEQRRGRNAHPPQPQHREVLHPNDLSQDRRHQPHPGGSVGRSPRLHTRPSPHRTLARRALTGPSATAGRSPAATWNRLR
jgi:DNA-binding NarL/FixJ family response regulator